jgi:hypothetical protein
MSAGAVKPASATALERERAVERFITFLESGHADPVLFTDDVFCDFTMPQWRLQAQGRDDTVALRRRGHPEPGQVVCNAMHCTPTGFVLELEERCSDARDDWYCRECFRVSLEGERAACPDGATRPG